MNSPWVCSRVENQNNSSSSFLETLACLVWKVWTDLAATYSGKTANLLQGPQLLWLLCDRSEPVLFRTNVSSSAAVSLRGQSLVRSAFIRASLLR